MDLVNMIIYAVAAILAYINAVRNDGHVIWFLAGTLFLFCAIRFAVKFVKSHKSEE